MPYLFAKKRVGHRPTDAKKPGIIRWSYSPTGPALGSGVSHLGKSLA
jgi:hypothetical protein